MILPVPWLSKITTTVTMLALVACFSPASRFQRHAEKQGLERRIEASLVVYQKGRLVDGRPIHVYLDGDGTPSLGRGRIATDPTSRDRVILDLIAADPATSVLVGRPCYYQRDPGCDPSLWTTARYSRPVVNQLVTVINAIVGNYPASSIVLIGYSGGGALAMLAAPAIERLDALVTIAGNLDTDAWAEHHGYAPLGGSLNPARQLPLSPAIMQFHFFGADDDNVPAALARDVIARQANAKLEVVPGFGHRCCWPELWDSTIARIDRAVARASPGG